MSDSVLFTLITLLLVVIHSIALGRHLPSRYRGDDLTDPWTFRERLKVYAYGWWVPIFMVLVVFGIAVFAAFVYSAAKNNPDLWLQFIETWWPWVVLLAVNQCLDYFEKRLEILRAESKSFKETVISILVEHQIAEFAKHHQLQPE